MEKITQIFNSKLSINPSESFGVDGVPIIVLASGLVAQTFVVQKRADDLKGVAVWTDYKPSSATPITLKNTQQQVILIRPGYYRLRPVGILITDNIIASIVWDSIVANSGVVATLSGN